MIHDALSFFRRLRSRYLALTAGWSVAHILVVPVVTVSSRADVVRNKAWSRVPARLVLGRNGWEGE